MASAVASEKLRARLFARMYDNDPGATDPTLASPDGGTTPWSWDLQDYPEGILFGVKPSIAGGALTKVRVLAYENADLSDSTPVEVKTTGTIALDDLSTNGGDQAWLEVHPSEVSHLGAALRYLAVEITHATGTDESVVAVVGLPRFARSGLTATQQA